MIGAVSRKGHVRLPAPHAGQQAVRAQAKRFNWLSAGRRWRKTTLLMAIAVEAAIHSKKVIWGAPIYDQVRVAWDETRKAVGASAVFNISRMTADFPGGGQILYRSLDNPDNVRGHTADGVVIDEAADVSPAAWTESLRPMLIDTKGWAWIIGTPKGLNWFYDGFTAALNRPDSMAWQSPTLGARIVDGVIERVLHPLENPNIPWDEMVQLFNTTPESSFKQEILAEFVQDEGAVFRNVDACLTALPTTPGAHRDHLIVGGIDWGKSHDFTAMSLFCCHCLREVFLDRFNQVGWDFQRGRLLTQLELWGARHVRVETNSIGSPNLEALRQAAPDSIILTGFETTFKSKAPLIQRLALAFEKGIATWLSDPVAKHELLAYEATVTETGYTKYSAPEGGFDDTVVARALAWKAARPYVPAPMTEDERIESQLPDHLKAGNEPNGDAWQRDAWLTARSLAEGKIRKAEEKRNPDLDDPWKGASPVDNMSSSPWADWERQ